MSNYQSTNRQRLIKVRSIQPKKHTEGTSRHDLPIDEEKTLTYSELESSRIELQTLQQKREKMLQDTMKEIKAQKESWENEKNVLMRQAHEDGYQAGFKKGEKEGLEQYTGKIRQVNDLVNTTTKDYHKILEQSDQTIVDLSIHIAERIITAKLADNPGYYLKIVKEALQEIKDQSVISIYSHPKNYGFLVKQKDELMNTVDGDTKISIYIDQKMSENQCLIEHQFGQIDASVDTQLEKIREALYQIEVESKS